MGEALYSVTEDAHSCLTLRQISGYHDSWVILGLTRPGLLSPFSTTWTLLSKRGSLRGLFLFSPSWECQSVSSEIQSVISKVYHVCQLLFSIFLSWFSFSCRTHHGWSSLASTWHAEQSEGLINFSHQSSLKVQCFNCLSSDWPWLCIPAILLTSTSASSSLFVCDLKAILSPCRFVPYYSCLSFGQEWASSVTQC